MSLFIENLRLIHIGKTLHERNQLLDNVHIYFSIVTDIRLTVEVITSNLRLILSGIRRLKSSSNEKTNYNIDQ